MDSLESLGMDLGTRTRKLENNEEEKAVCSEVRHNREASKRVDEESFVEIDARKDFHVNLRRKCLQRKGSS